LSTFCVDWLEIGIFNQPSDKNYILSVQNIDMRIPKKIDPCPIVESIIELRFKPSVPTDAVFGLIYNQVKNSYQEVQKLPILDLPEQIRNQDKNLLYRPYHKLRNEQYDLNIGPRVISLIKKEPYNGWERFSADTYDLIEQVAHAGIVKTIERLGVRYINFFDSNIYDKVDLKLLLGDKNFIKNDTYIKNVYEDSGIKIILQLGNNVSYNKSGSVKTGSLIDVDVSRYNLGDAFISSPNEILNEMHKKEKEVFFEILQDDFVNQLNPEY